MDIVLFGAPGCGKGTQAARLPWLRHISTGELFRIARAVRTPIGLQIEGLLGMGNLIPDEITIGLVEEVIDGPATVWDGFPRTVPQAEAFDRMLSTRGREITAIINLVVPEDVLLDRVVKRFEVSQRDDDNPESFAVRLATYHRKTSPVLDHYGDRVTTLDGTETPEQIGSRIAALVL